MSAVLVFEGGPVDGLRKDCSCWPPQEQFKVKGGHYERIGPVPDKRPRGIMGFKYVWSPDA